MKEKIYVVIAYRFGNRESHSYFVGAFDNKIDAIKIAAEENEYRGRKYDCEIIETKINSYKKGFEYIIGLEEYF